MEQALLVGKQVLVIFIYIFLGYICTKRGVISRSAGKSFSNLTMVLVMPCIIISSYIRPMQAEHNMGLVLAFGLAAFYHIITIAAAAFLVKDNGTDRARIERLGIVFSNCGFMGIPLIRVVAGEIGVFYAVAYISVFNVLVWSYGVMTLSGERKINGKAILLNPGVIGFFVGLCIYLLQLPVPALLHQAVDGLSTLNTPLSMITTGIFLAQVDLKKVLGQGRLFLISAYRLLLMPLIMLALLKVLGVSSWIEGAPLVLITSMLACACPSAATVVLLPARYEMEGEYGAQILGVTTLLSVLTLPLITYLTSAWI